MSTLEAWAAAMQNDLWDQLHNDLREAANGSWSIAAERTVTHLVGVVPLRIPRSATDSVAKLLLPW